MGGRSLCLVPAECPRATSWTIASSWGEYPWGSDGTRAQIPTTAWSHFPYCPFLPRGYQATSLKASPLLLRDIGSTGLGVRSGF